MGSSDEPVSVPKTLDEAFAYLETLDGLEDFIKLGPSSFHHGLGRWIRNNWGFWKKEGPLYSELVKLGLEHPDDMSGLILESFHRKKTGKPLNLEGQVNRYQAYWAAQATEEAPQAITIPEKPQSTITQEAEAMVDRLMAEVASKVNTLLAFTPFTGDGIAKGDQLFHELRRQLDEKLTKLQLVYGQAANRLVKSYLESLEEE